MFDGLYNELKFARCAMYRRYSTRMQRNASLEDQERCCRDLAAQKSWEILNEHNYKDAARSGTMRANRPGLAALQAAAKKSPRPFDYVIVDDTSRLSRDLGDILTLEQEFKSYGVELYFVKQKLDSKNPHFRLMLTIYGMADEQMIAQYRTKSREGVIGRVLAGYNGGSVPYGYDGIKELSDTPTASGQAASKGTWLVVNEDQASTIRRVMEEFADGQSVWGICMRFNAEGIVWPRAKNGKWTADTIKHILHNEKYRGINVWNLTTQSKDRSAGQTIKRPRPANEHLRVLAPHLRIVSDELWDQVQATQPACVQLHGAFQFEPR